MAQILASGVFLSLICLSVCAPDGLKKNSLDDPLSDEFIDYINSLNTSWVAGRNFAKDTPLSHLKNLCGVRPGGPRLPVKVHDWENEDIPTEFDSRTKWSNCPTIKEIRDQGHCGSCWAFAAVTAISDRICIHSNAKTQSHISAENLVACACSGCFGGSVSGGWKYYKDNGLVSGGPYHSKQGCQPYTIETCKYKAPCMDFQATPQCKGTCEAGYNKTFTEDLHFASEVYMVHGEKAYQVEIMKNGPIEVGFVVYEDFIHYKSGVYQHKSGQYLGGHAVRIIGWGVENELPYWIIANSWNTVWGDHGYFKILRGSDECGIECGAAAGIPKPYSDY